jgi:hypothetical protein
MQKIRMGRISKNFSLIFILILTFSILTMIVAQTVEAQIGVDVRFNAESLTTVVNQPIEFTATATMGTPPYSYQWYTQLWSKDPKAPAANPDGPIVTVSGATFSTFNFTESSPGLYGISIRVSDSANKSVYDVFQPGGIWVTVLSSPTPSPNPSTATPTPTPTPSPTPTVPEFSWLVLLPLMMVILFIAVKLRHRKPFSQNKPNV